MSVRLSVGLVCHDTDLVTLEKCLLSLLLEVNAVIANNLISSANVVLLDNSEDEVYSQSLCDCVNKLCFPVSVKLTILTSGNNGFGAGHNEILASSSSEIHLIANPDLEFLPNSILSAVNRIDPGRTGIVLPVILDSQGCPQRLHFRKFSPAHILLRSIAPDFVKKIFQKSISEAAYKNVRTHVPINSSSVFSGCCMLFERLTLERIGGFDECYFLYFEDYDLSLRALKTTSALIEPNFQVAHHGGNASRKGAEHIYRFMASALRFYWARLKLMIGINKEIC